MEGMQCSADRQTGRDEGEEERRDGWGRGRKSARKRQFVNTHHDVMGWDGMGCNGEFRMGEEMDNFEGLIDLQGNSEDWMIWIGLEWNWEWTRDCE